MNQPQPQPQPDNLFDPYSRDHRIEIQDTSVEIPAEKLIFLFTKTLQQIDAPSLVRIQADPNSINLLSQNHKHAQIAAETAIRNRETIENRYNNKVAALRKKQDALESELVSLRQQIRSQEQESINTANQINMKNEQTSQQRSIGLRTGADCLPLVSEVSNSLINLYRTNSFIRMSLRDIADYAYEEDILLSTKCQHEVFHFMIKSILDRLEEMKFEFLKQHKLLPQHQVYKNFVSIFIELTKRNLFLSTDPNPSKQVGPTENFLFQDFLKLDRAKLFNQIIQITSFPSEDWEDDETDLFSVFNQLGFYISILWLSGHKLNWHSYHYRESVLLKTNDKGWMGIPGPNAHGEVPVCIAPQLELDGAVVSPGIYINIPQAEFESKFTQSN